MGLVSFPSTLPQPSVLAMSAAERRLLSSIAEGRQQVRLLQWDFLGYENLQWEFNAAQAAIFQQWWDYALIEGGRWFQANWPRVSSTSNGVCRFLLPPQWRLIGHEYWAVTVGTELRGAAQEPQAASLLLGLHFNGDFKDEAYGHQIEYQTQPFSTAVTFSSAAPKFGAHAISTVYDHIYFSDNRGTLIFNYYGEFQISFFAKIAGVGPFGVSGGTVVELLAWGYPNGNSNVHPSGGANPPPEHTGQFNIWVRGDATLADLLFRYPTLNPTSGFFESHVLQSMTFGSRFGVPVDNAWHHVGIAGDTNGIRAYIDGGLVADDGDRNPANPRAAGLRPMWAGTRYSDQRFLLFKTFAGSNSSASDPYGPSEFPRAMASAAQFDGRAEDLEIRSGKGCVTFIGSTITVPTAAFLP